MIEGRRHGLSEDELQQLAEKLAILIAESHSCPLTTDQQKEVMEIITAKKWTVKAVLWFFGGIMWLAGVIIVLGLKDIYNYITTHISWGK